MGVRVREKVKDSKVYWIFIKHAGRRSSKMVGDHKAAQRVASELRARLAQGDLHLAGASPTLEAFATEWLKRYPLLQPVRPGTMDNHRSFVTQHLIPFFGGMPVASITTTTVENFIVSKRQAGGSTRFQGRPLSESSLRTGLASLRLVLQAAVRAGHLRANPLDGLGRIKRNGDENVDPFTGAELRAILGAAQRLRPDFGTMLRLWAQTGVRAGEVCGLQWQDLDLEGGTALIRRSWSRCRLGPTKTRIIRAVSFLHPTTEGTAEWRPGATQESRAILTGLRRLTVRSLEPATFVFGDGTVPISPTRWISIVTGSASWRLPRSATVPRSSLRHTFASTMLSRNTPLLYVQKAGGWRSASVLLRVYARWVPEGIEAAAIAHPAAPQGHPVAIASA